MLSISISDIYRHKNFDQMGDLLIKLCMMNMLKFDLLSFLKNVVIAMHYKYAKVWSHELIEECRHCYAL